jgi:anti-sigma28 factor (negative regulator of flagellin synthesis)
MSGKDDGEKPLKAKDEDVEEAYSAEYLRECASGSAREERLAELRRRIQLGAYRVDPETVAEELLRRGDLASD